MQQVQAMTPEALLAFPSCGFMGCSPLQLAWCWHHHGSNMPMAERSVLPVQDGAGTRGCTGLARAKAIYLTHGVLTICTGVGVTVLGLPCKWHTGFLC